MASSIAIFSRRLSRSLLNTIKHSSLSKNFCTNLPIDELNEESEYEDLGAAPDGNTSPPSSSSSSSTSSNKQQDIFQRPLENGLDVGVYKAILVGKAGQVPFQKRLKSGRIVTMFSLGTGGIRNNRRPFDNEVPREYADRCSVQWHRVAIYPDGLGGLAMENVTPGTTMYVEGNLETKIFSDPISGIIKRVREIAIRRDGRFLILGKDDVKDEKDMKGVGYY